MKTKNEFREYIKNQFSQKKSDSFKDENISIEHKLLYLLEQSESKTICIYEHMSDEVQTQQLIVTLEEKWYKILTPQVISETEMIFIDSEYEPYEKEIDIFIIPGRAFTNDWKRLGRGKWYYDRCLSQKIYKKSKKVWICYNFQVLENIPTQKHDIKMDLIIHN